MNSLYTFLICFVIIYGVYFFTVVNRKKGLESFKNGKQLEFFKTVYKLDFRKINVKGFANSFALTNAFIMSLVVTTMECIDNLILKMLVGFILIIILMIISYKLLGNYYKKKEGR